MCSILFAGGLENICCRISVLTHGLLLLFVCVCRAGGEELHSDCLAVVQAPKVQVDPQLTLPLDINNYLMTHYIRAMFRVIMKIHAQLCSDRVRGHYTDLHFSHVDFL